MALEVQFTRRDKEVLSEVEQATLKALAEIGARAEAWAKKECPVDTGRLRNSITWATSDAHGNFDPFAVGGDSTPHGRAEKDTVAIGTNVEYAQDQEFNEGYSHMKRQKGGGYKQVGNAHFLRNSITKHDDEYYKVLEKHFKGVS